MCCRRCRVIDDAMRIALERLEARERGAQRAPLVTRIGVSEAFYQELDKQTKILNRHVRALRM